MAWKIVKLTLLFSFFVGLTLSCGNDDPEIIDLPDYGNNDKPEAPDNIYDSEKAFMMVEQSQHRVAIVDQPSGKIMWQWKASDSPQIPDNRKSWFNTNDEVKPVYDRRYFVTTSSGGGVAMVRIADKKVMFYAKPDGNPHSAEILPDGNLVVASSTGATLKVYKVDTVACYAEAPAQTYSLPDGHNVVWDKANKLLWATSGTTGQAFLHSYTYNYDGNNPQLTPGMSYPLPTGQTSPHDLFPVYGENKLWLSTGQSVQVFDVATRAFSKAYDMTNIKSVSSGPAGFPVMVLKPTTDYWSNRLITTTNSIVYDGESNYKIYKARWFLNNLFSYPDNDQFRQP